MNSFVKILLYFCHSAISQFLVIGCSELKLVQTAQFDQLIQLLNLIDIYCGDVFNWLTCMLISKNEKNDVQQGLAYRAYMGGEIT